MFVEQKEIQKIKSDLGDILSKMNSPKEDNMHLESNFVSGDMIRDMFKQRKIENEREEERIRKKKEVQNIKIGLLITIIGGIIVLLIGKYVIK